MKIRTTWTSVAGSYNECSQISRVGLHSLKQNTESVTLNYFISVQTQISTRYAQCNIWRPYLHRGTDYKLQSGCFNCFSFSHTEKNSFQIVNLTLCQYKFQLCIKNKKQENQNFSFIVYCCSQKFTYTHHEHKCHKLGVFILVLLPFIC